MKKLKAIFKYIFKGGALDGAKTPLALVFLALTKYGILPAINVEDGFTLDEIMLVWAAVHTKLKEAGIL